VAAASADRRSECWDATADNDRESLSNFSSRGASRARSRVVGHYTARTAALLPGYEVGFSPEPVPSGRADGRPLGPSTAVRRAQTTGLALIAEGEHISGNVAVRLLVEVISPNHRRQGGRLRRTLAHPSGARSLCVRPVSPSLTRPRPAAGRSSLSMPTTRVCSPWYTGQVLKSNEAGSPCIYMNVSRATWSETPGSGTGPTRSTCPPVRKGLPSARNACLGRQGFSYADPRTGGRSW
jgi:hypothetical protein